MQEIVAYGSGLRNCTRLIMEKIKKNINYLWWILKITYGSLFIFVGADKFFNILTNWDRFISTVCLEIIPISPTVFLHIFGILQIIIGLLILSAYTMLGAIIGLIVLLGIFLNLLFTQDFTVVLTHDFIMILGLIVLIELTRIKRSY